MFKHAKVESVSSFSLASPGFPEGSDLGEKTDPGEGWEGRKREKGRGRKHRSPATAFISLCFLTAGEMRPGEM